MGPSRGGTGYLRSSSRRKKSRADVDEQEARNLMALLAPPGSAMDADYPPGHSRMPDIGGAFLDRPGRPSIGPSRPTGVSPLLGNAPRAPVVPGTGRPRLGNVIQAPGYAVPPMGLRPAGPTAPGAIEPQPLPEMWNPEPNPVDARAYPALSEDPIGALDEEDEEQPGFFARMFGQPKDAEGESSPMSLALLSAGLGILANNYGHYGQAGPAIGKGAMQGLKTYIGERDRADQRKREKQAQVGEDAKREAYAQQLAMQNRKMQAEESRSISDEARFRTLNELPDGPQRNMLLEEIVARQGGAQHILKARSPQAPASGTEAERQMARITAYMTKKNSGEPTTALEDMEYQNALALLQRPKTYVDQQTGRIFQQPSVNVPDYADRGSGGFREVPVPKGEGRKSLDQKDQEWLRNVGGQTEQLNSLVGTFQPNYGGLLWGPVAEAALAAGRALPREMVGTFKDEAAWWMRYYKWANTDRLAQTGLTLTASEEKAWERATPRPSDTPDVIQSKLAEQTGLLENKLARELTGLAADGKNMSAAEGYAGLHAYDPAAKPTAPRKKNSVQEEEDRKRRRKKFLGGG